MARVGGDTNSASAEFYFNLTNNSFLMRSTEDSLCLATW